MREIKFKAEYKNKIYEVIAIFFDINQVQLKRENCLSIDVAMIDCKLLDFTGLQDVTGRDIYEGDIVDVGKVMQRLCIIEFKNAKFVLKFQDDFEVGSPTDIDMFIDRIRIIGNIYENPELLKYDEE